MTQSAAVFIGHAAVQVELPSPDCEVLPGLEWGAVDAFPTPAYWAYQVLARRVTGRTPGYRLGRTLTEEVAACLLGGHGIPAAVGVAAFRKLQHAGALTGALSESELLLLLSQPIQMEGRTVKYRFARQKARYLSVSLDRISTDPPPTVTGRVLRDWLLALPGIGYKTASWIARNWLDADDVAILDIHILRAGALAGFFCDSLTVERNYLELEGQFLKFSEALGVRASELDSVIWHEMMSSPMTVAHLMGGRRRGVRPAVTQSGQSRSHRRGTYKGDPDAGQARLID